MNLLTNKFSGAAIDVEGIVALLVVGVSVLKEKAVGAELGLGDIVHALVVKIALLGIGKETVFLGTVEG